jgi:hypothetical protein
MSCYEREEGEFKLPANEYRRVRTATIRAYNTWMTIQYDKAVDLWVKAKNALHGLRGKKRAEAFHSLAERTNASWDARYAVWRGGKLVKPKKQNYPTLPTTKTCVVGFRETSISFNNTKNTIYWRVDENNHAVDAAHEHPVGNAFWRAMDRVQWTSRTGGELRYENEYDREAWAGPTIRKFGRNAA